MVATSVDPFMMAPGEPADPTDNNVPDPNQEDKDEPQGPPMTPPVTGGEKAKSLAEGLAEAFAQRGEPNALGEPGEGGEEGEGGSSAAAATPDPDTPEGTEGEGEGSGQEPEPTPEGGVAPPTPTTPLPPQPSAFDINQAAIETFGRPLTPQEAYTLFATSDAMARLTPEQQAQVNAILQGQTPVTQPQTKPEPDDDVDPFIKEQVSKIVSPIQEELTPLREGLAQVNQFVQTQAEQQAAEQRARVLSQIETARDEWAGQMELSDEDRDKLEGLVVSSGIMPGLYAAHNQDAGAAMKAALEQVFWATPEYREKAFKTQMDKLTADNDEIDRRKNKAGSLAGGGASVSREQTQPTTPKGRQAAMVAELSEAMSGTQTG